MHTSTVSCPLIQPRPFESISPRAPHVDGAWPIDMCSDVWFDPCRTTTLPIACMREWRDACSASGSSATC
jgi:hypothetical protein